MSTPSLSELKARNEFYKKDSIIPQRVLKSGRKKKHHITFGSDTWLVPTKSGYLCICDTGSNGAALKTSYKLRNAQMVCSPYSGTTHWLGNTNRTNDQHEADVLNQLAKMEKKS